MPAIDPELLMTTGSFRAGRLQHVTKKWTAEQAFLDPSAASRRECDCRALELRCVFLGGPVSGRITHRTPDAEPNESAYGDRFGLPGSPHPEPKGTSVIAIVLDEYIGAPCDPRDQCAWGLIMLRLESIGPCLG